MPFPAFDRSRLKIRPLAERTHDLDLGSVLALTAPRVAFDNPALSKIAGAVRAAHKIRKSVESAPPGPSTILMMGAHVIRAGVSRFIIDLMTRGIVTHVAMNGAGPIHDWEFAQ